MTWAWRDPDEDFWWSPAGFAVWGLLFGLLGWSWTGRALLVPAGAVGGLAVAFSLVVYRRSRR